MAVGVGVGDAEFAKFVSGRRRRLGLTQEELAERAGVSVRTVRNLEAGTVRRPTGYTIRSVATALGLDQARSTRLVLATRMGGAAGAMALRTPYHPAVAGWAGDRIRYGAGMSAETPATVPANAYVVRDDAEALEIARRLSADFAVEAATRDAERRLPGPELDALSASGLLGVTVPREYGGADVRAETIAEVFRLLAVADPNIAQIPQSHIVYVNVLRQQGSAAQREFFFGEVLAGRRFGNAQSETGTKHVQDYRTRLVPDGDGFLLRGTKQYSTGALFADWIPVLAKDPDERIMVAYVPRDAPGLTVIDDWAGMGQRTTASGTVRLDDVRVPADRVVPHHLTFAGPQLHGALAQLLHAAIDVGIAGGALAEGVEFVRTKARPWFEAGVDRAADDPLIIQRVGELTVKVRAAEALLAAAGRAVDAARADLTDESAGAASIAVATAKAYADPVAVELANAVFELGGTRSALDQLNLHRHWRNARTHTLHDPARWKLQHIGRYVLNNQLPPRHGVL